MKAVACIESCHQGSAWLQGQLGMQDQGMLGKGIKGRKQGSLCWFCKLLFVAVVSFCFVLFYLLTRYLQGPLSLLPCMWDWSPVITLELQQNSCAAEVREQVQKLAREIQRPARSDPETSQVRSRDQPGQVQSPARTGPETSQDRARGQLGSTILGPCPLTQCHPMCCTSSSQRLCSLPVTLLRGDPARQEPIDQVTLANFCTSSQ